MSSIATSPPVDAVAHAADRIDRIGGHPARRVAVVLFAGYVLVGVSLTGVGLLLTEVLLEGRLGRWDESTSRSLAEERTAWLTDVTGVAGFIADTLPVIFVATAASAVILWWRGWREALVVPSALILELAIFLSVNTLVDRARPAVPRLDSTPATGSFPSGHASAAVCLYLGLAVLVAGWLRRTNALRWVVLAAGVTMPVLVAFARLYRGMHHVTDVILGLVLGVAALWFAVQALRTSTTEVADEVDG